MLNLLGLGNSRAKFAFKHHSSTSATLGPREEPGDMSESARERGWHQAGFPSPQSKVKKSVPSESVTECEMED